MLIGTRIEAFDAGMEAANELDVRDDALPDDLAVFAHRKASELLVPVRLLDVFENGLRLRLEERGIEYVCGGVEKLHPASALHVDFGRLHGRRLDAMQKYAELDRQDATQRHVRWPPPAHAIVHGDMMTFACRLRVVQRERADGDDPPKSAPLRRYRCELETRRVCAKTFDDAARFALERARELAKDDGVDAGAAIHVEVKADFPCGPNDTFVAVV